ncbi:glycerol dehydratase reactivase beta/small subunit family protein [Acerihabitans arboris]|uniref:Propanediol dehydratase n=1 Tax=Acerihabitans arboris TaxID=2691583 RepID=A0A845SIV5_9GAMM|nr:glycerol dehydratase reactivase beta/small subunit family protein [Acerihabitans arboris]NDL63197.1 propanediol dehydratase [Acerihabitans arboris]
MGLPDISHPAIIVTLCGRAGRDGWRQLLLGMEEEGIPFHLYDAGDDDASPATLAHQAANASPLAVGVAVGARDLVVHDPHLPVDRPLFVLRDYARLPAQEIRRLGCNAARLVKGLPFK